MLYYLQHGFHFMLSLVARGDGSGGGGGGGGGRGHWPPRFIAWGEQNGTQLADLSIELHWVMNSIHIAEPIKYYVSSAAGYITQLVFLQLSFGKSDVLASWERR